MLRTEIPLCEKYRPPIVSIIFFEDQVDEENSRCLEGCKRIEGLDSDEVEERMRLGYRGNPRLFSLAFGGKYRVDS